MIITKLILTDFGLYSGSHEFALRPQSGPEGLRPLVLFGGKNGAGKTTILDAVRLCLYGRDALGFRVRPADYHEYLARRIHNSRQRTADRAMVGIEFEYVQHGTPSLFRVERSWVKTEHEVVEHFGLQKDGELQFGIGPEYWQDLLKDLIPVGLADLFFFDGEKIQSLADDARGNLVLGQALKDLLGVNLVEQLESDLSIYLTRQGTSAQTVELDHRLAELEQQQQQLNDTLQAHHQDKANRQSQLYHLKNKIAEKAAEITSRGGLFAERYQATKARKDELHVIMAQERRGIEESCEQLLPFALAPTLARQVARQLQAEADQEYQHSTRAVLHEQATILSQELDRDAFWQDIGAQVPEDVRVTISKRVQEQLLTQAVVAGEDIPILHGLSAQDRNRLLLVIDEALGPVRLRSQAHLRQLQAAQVELEQVDRVLLAVPPEELLAPLLQEKDALDQELTAVKAQFDQCTEAERQTTHALGEITRQIAKLRADLEQNALRSDKGQLAQKARTVMTAFRQELLRLKISDLEASFTDYFNRLARKQEFVSHAIINEHDFSMTLVSQEGRFIPTVQLSAGEKQIYAIALLWALRAVAARPLPIIIDTPLGRLDSSHRQNLVEHYFPNASHQVILLSTDTEIDETYFAALEPYISHAYHLVYDDVTGTTTAQAGYFWQATHDQEPRYATQ